jgi:hypothetical protein
MAIKLGIVGVPNSGKSFSRKTIKNGEEVFIIAPSHKATHITDNKGKPLKRFNISIEGVGSSTKEIMDKFPSSFATSHDVAKQSIKTDKKVTYEGNYVTVRGLKHLEMYLQLVDKKLPNIKTVILPDFTHFISAIIASKEFIKRKAGGEAFQRFWELAGESLESFILSIDDLRDDLIVVTEYHSEYSDVDEMYKIFVPGGKMLEEKFKLDSYYDYMLYTHVKMKESKEVESYNFVTRRWDKYNARCSELFEDTLIPNDLSKVLSEMRKQLGL